MLEFRAPTERHADGQSNYAYEGDEFIELDEEEPKNEGLSGARRRGISSSNSSSSSNSYEVVGA